MGIRSFRMDCEEEAAKAGGDETKSLESNDPLKKKQILQIGLLIFGSLSVLILIIVVAYFSFQLFVL